MTRLRSIGFALCFGLLPTSAAFAVDGVFEINQVCATATGCFSGDGAGFPVTISKPGSYRLTGNLTADPQQLSAIEITSSEVQLDLNGFAVLDGAVMRAIWSTESRVSVLNGTISGSFGSGIVLEGTLSRVEGVVVDISGVNQAILLGDRCLLTNSRSDGGTAPAILLGNYCVARGNTIHATANGPALEMGSNATAVENSVRGDSGIAAGTRSTLVNNSVLCHTGAGILATSSSVIGNAVTSGAWHGISCDRCIVSGNVSNGNGGFGLNDSSKSTAYSNNQFDDNNGGNPNPQVSGGIETGANVCGGNTTCP